MKRARYLELAKIADEICVKLMESGVKPNEGCIIRQIAETQWNNMRASYQEIQVGLSNQIAEQPVDVCNDTLSDSL